MCEYLLCLSLLISAGLSCWHNIFLMRTYSRADRSDRRASASSRHGHAERPAKRRRVHSDARDKRKAKERADHDSPPEPSSSTTPSSPHPEVFSPKAPSETATPPSSPPSWQSSLTEHSNPTINASSSASSRAPSREPLRQTSGNTQKRQRAGKKVRLVQTQIDLGGKIHKTCSTCGMEYLPSNSEDAALHKKFHNKNNNGILVSKAFVEATKDRKLAEVGQWQHIIAISRLDPRVLRHQAEEVLNIANTELGSITFEEKTLWSRESIEGKTRRDADGATEDGQEVDYNPTPHKKSAGRDRFTLYLLLRNKKCVGLCLAEKISRAHRVVELNGQTQILQDRHAKSSAIAISKDADPALLGISRIWTSSAHRNEGVATALLDCAAGNFLYGMKIPKHQVAFSQPTESGGRLAKKWFEREYGWHVYAD